MGPEAIPGLAFRIAAAEQRLDAAESSRGRMWDRIGEVDKQQGIAQSKIGDVAADVGEVKAICASLQQTSATRADMEKVENKVNGVIAEVSGVKVKMAAYGALGGAAGSLAIGIVVALATRAIGG